MTGRPSKARFSLGSGENLKKKLKSADSQLHNYAKVEEDRFIDGTSREAATWTPRRGDPRTHGRFWRRQRRDRWRASRIQHLWVLLAKSFQAVAPWGGRSTISRPSLARNPCSSWEEPQQKVFEIGSHLMALFCLVVLVRAKRGCSPATLFKSFLSARNVFKSCKFSCITLNYSNRQLTHGE